MFRDYLHRLRPAGESKESDEFPAAERRRNRFLKWLDTAGATLNGEPTPTMDGFDEDVDMEGSVDD